MRSSYSGFEACNFFVGKSVRLGDDGNQVDLGMESSHDLNIQGLQRVTSGLNEENTGVNSVVNNVHPVDLVLCIKIGIESLLNVVHNWSP